MDGKYEQHEDIRPPEYFQTGFDADLPQILTSNPKEAARTVIEDLEVYAMIRGFSTGEGYDGTFHDQLSTWHVDKDAQVGFALALKRTYEPRVTLEAVYYELDLGSKEQPDIISTHNIKIYDFDFKSIDEQSATLSTELTHEDLEVIFAMTDKCKEAVMHDNPPNNSLEIERILSEQYTKEPSELPPNIHDEEEKAAIARSARVAIRKHAAKELGLITVAVFQVRGQETISGEVTAYRNDEEDDHTVMDIRLLKQEDYVEPEMAEIEYLDVPKSAIDGDNLTDLDLDTEGARDLFENGRLIKSTTFEEVWGDPYGVRLSVPKFGQD